VILFYAALAFLSGVAAAALGLAAAWPLVALGGAGVCAGCLLGRRPREAILVVLLAVLALSGIDRFEESRPSDKPTGVALLNDLEDGEGSPLRVTLRGVIADEPEERETTRRYTLRVEAYVSPDGWQPAGGRVQVTSRLYPTYAYGDLVQLTGHLETPPVLGDFDYREYLARRGIVSTMLFPRTEVLGGGSGSDITRLLIDARRPLGNALERALPEPESALARGILLGQRASIPDGLMDDFNRAGISHLIAISGQNVAIVAAFVVGSLAWLIGRRPATAVAIVFVLVYAVFVGASPSVLRAAVMAVVMLGATLAGRPGSALSSVVLAAGLLVAWRPLIVDDVAFQLSFAATLGIVLAAERLRQLISPRLGGLPGWLAAPLAENVAITSAASLAVLPVIAGSFGRLSLVSLPANLLAAPAFVLALFGSGLAALTGAIDPTLGRLAGELAYLPLTYLVRLGRFAADLPGASVELRSFGLIEAILVYALLSLVWLGLKHKRAPDVESPRTRRLSPALAAAAILSLLAALVWWGVLSPDTQRLQLTVLDVGQGDAILIETPQGHRILVDGGPSGAGLAQALGRELPPSARRIDLIVLTHAQDDHVTGLVELLQRYNVGAALAGPLEGETGAYRAWRDELSRQDVPLLPAVAGQRFDLGEGVLIEVIGPPPQGVTGSEDDLNNNSVVLRLVYGEVSFLLTGDLAADGEAALLASPADLHATVLKVGHNGSDGSTTPAFLDAVSPSLAVISAGADNVFGHPSPTTRLRLAGVPLLRTDANGDIRFETDGAALWVAFARGGYSRVDFGLVR